MSGFKSFSDPIELEIANGLTGVVGPNGCGKSNIVEALRWVMGESSARGLRGSEMEDVIFNGSGLRPAHDLAEVCLTLHGDLRIFGSDGASGEVQVSRRIGRGTGSVFRINGKEVRSRDVQVAFADFSSGSRSASMIGQGQIAFVVEAKPEERRRLLENAAGIGGMHARRREAELKLHATEANLTRVVDRLGQQQARHDELEKQSRQAKRFTKIQADIRRIDAILVLAELDNAATARDRARANITEAETFCATSSERMALLKSARASHETDLGRLREARESHSQLLARLRERSDRMQAEHELRQTRFAELRDQFEHFATDRDTIGERIEASRGEREELEQRTTGYADEMSALEEQIRQLAACQGEQEEAAGLAETALREIAERRADLRGDRQSLIASHNEADERRLVCVARKREVDDRLGELDEVLAAQQELQIPDLDAIATQLEQTRQQSRTLGREIVALREEQASRAQARTSTAENVARLEARLRERDVNAERLGDRLDELRARRELLISRRKTLAQDHQGLETRIEGLATEALRVSREQARARRHGFERDQEQAVSDEHDLRDQLVEAQDRVDGLKVELGRLEAERDAIQPMLRPLGEHPIWHDVVVDGQHELALAAALGDDLLADRERTAPTHWHQVECATPALPEGLRPLKDVVRGPAQLGPRLSQIGIASSAGEALRLQSKLSVGQRIVTHEGGLWRWDGFVRRPEAADPGAAQIRQQRRWAKIETQIVAKQEELDAAIVAAASMKSDHQETANKRADLAKQLDQASRDLDRLDRDFEAQARERELLQARSHELREELGSIERDLAPLVDGIASYEQSLAELDDRDELAAELRNGRRLADAAEAGLAEATRKLHEFEAKREQAGQDAERIAGELERQRAAAEAARRQQDEATRQHHAETQTLLHERSQIESELERVSARAGEANERLEQLDAGIAEIDVEFAERENEARAHRNAQIESRDELAAARQREAELRVYHERAKVELQRHAEELKDLERRHAEITGKLARLDPELAKARAHLDEAADLSTIAQELMRVEERLAELDQTIGATAQSLRNVVGELEELEHAFGEARERIAAFKRDIEHAEERYETARENAYGRLQRLPPELRAELEKFECPEPAELERLGEELQKLAASRDRLGAVNLRAAEEIAELEAEMARTREEEAELQAAVERLKRAISTLNSEARQRLEKVFGTVDDHFRRLFRRLFGGGRANLRLVNLEDPLKAGLELDAMPPGKKLQSIDLLSGGEKSLTALALVFALFLSRPTPLCVLDEVDAALDDANVDRFVLLMEEIASESGTRFLVVTHHPLTMARMDRLYGVTMAEQGVSRLVSVALEQAVEMRAA